MMTLAFWENLKIMFNPELIRSKFCEKLSRLILYGYVLLWGSIALIDS